MASLATEAGVITLRNALTGDTSILTCTNRSLLESTCPPDFIFDAGDQDHMATRNQEPPTDTMSRIMDPGTALPPTEEALIQELLDWEKGVGDPLMTPSLEVPFKDVENMVNEVLAIPAAQGTQFPVRAFYNCGCRNLEIK